MLVIILICVYIVINFTLLENVYYVQSTDQWLYYLAFKILVLYFITHNNPALGFTYPANQIFSGLGLKPLAWNPNLYK